MVELSAFGTVHIDRLSKVTDELDEFADDTRELKANVTGVGENVVAHPDLHSFTIQIEEDTTYRGPAKVEITSASLDGITGQIVDERQTKSQKHSISDNPFR